MGAYKKTGEILAEEGIIGSAVIDEIVAAQKGTQMRFGDLLRCKGLASEDDIAKTLSRQHGLEYADIRNFNIMPDVLIHVPGDMAKRHSILPLYSEGRTLFVITADPLNLDSLKDIEFHSGMKIRTLIGSQGAVAEAIRHHYRFDASVSDFPGPESAAGNLREPETEGNSAPVIRLVNLLLSEAVENRASDIHIEPSGESLTVRYRIDGVLLEKARLPSGLHGPLTSRLKILARLNIAERRLPQDGGFRLKISNTEIDVRISTLPVSGGEKTVIRILDHNQTTVSLENLGLSHNDYDTVQKLIQRKKGIILVTGPTGSGKTTTLYSIINRIKSGMLNIVTVEDPVEYNIAGINQVQARSDIGLTFARCLRSILRQDPDVILIGEIRDEETAAIAFRAAMTGHLVLSTLHTNDSVSAVTRLIDIGIPGHIIASTVIGIIAQRLVRRLCCNCRNGQNSTGRCYSCNRTGYSGRTGIFEIFTVKPKARQLIVSGGTEADMRDAAVREGMMSLCDDAAVKIGNGITNEEEVCRVIDSAALM
ncbi:MAG: Flp pilus assembly complex ATPase component TadA [Nitrospirae bacterium]|nr:Flp pilus assembly complex ATPase component TadA [Nitrospirota bacterium]